MAEVSIDLNMVRVTNSCDEFVAKSRGVRTEASWRRWFALLPSVDIVKTDGVYPDVDKKDRFRRKPLPAVILLPEGTGCVWISVTIRWDM